MLGAIIGDLAGSIYEYDQIKNHKSLLPIEFKSVMGECYFKINECVREY